MFLQQTFKIIPELNLVVFCWKGIVTLESWIELKKRFLAHKDFSLNLKYFEDFRNLTFNVSIEDIKKYIDFAVKYEKQSQKSALLTTTPNQVTISIIYLSLKDDKLGKPLILSTIDRALNWLEIPKPKQHIVIETLELLETELAIKT